MRNSSSGIWTIFFTFKKWDSFNIAHRNSVENPCFKILYIGTSKDVSTFTRFLSNDCLDWSTKSCKIFVGLKAYLHLSNFCHSTSFNLLNNFCQCTMDGNSMGIKELSLVKHCCLTRPHSTQLLVISYVKKIFERSLLQHWSRGN